MTTILVMTMTLKKLILTLIAANTIQHHRGPRKTYKISSLKIPVSACHVTVNTGNVNSFPDISDVSRTGTAKNSKHRPVERMVQPSNICFSKW